MQKVAGIQATNVNELVFVKNEEVLTDTLTVAKMFNKEHHNVVKDVKRTIDSIADLSDEEAKEIGVDLGVVRFYDTEYKHPQNKQIYPMYLLNYDAFMLVTMGYTTKKAMLIKIKYINDFNKMKEQINKPRALTDKEQRIEMLKLSLEHEQRFEDHDERLTHLEDTMRIDGREEQVIQSKAKGVIVESLGGKKSHAYKTMSRKVFASFWNEFKRYFEVPRYGDIPKKQFDAAVEWINEWQPNTSTRMQIRKENMQMSMEDDAS